MGVAGLLSGVQTLAFGVVVARLLPGAKRLPALASPQEEFITRISVVIPARDEAERLPQCLEALRNSGADEVIVVDDQSSDDTAAIARKNGASVVLGAPLPAGWVGKPWALHQGLLVAKNEVVVCLDADTIVQTGLLPALVAELADHDIVTLAPKFLTSSTSEQALHSSMLTGLIYRFGPVGLRKSPRPDRIYGNGQCFAFRRSWIVREGGFSLAANQMNDDIALLRAAASRGARISFRDGRDLLQVRMYESTSEVWREWGRSLPMADLTTRSSRWFDICVLWLTLVMPPLRLLLRRATVSDYACISTRFALCFAIAPSYERKRLGVLLSPFFDLAATWRLTQATLDPVRSWRGRRYTPQGTEVR